MKSLIAAFACTLALSLNVGCDPVPRSVQRYLQHVKEQGFTYSMEKEYVCHMRPGGEMELTKKGVCDEFALNALYHLRHNLDIASLHLAWYYTEDTAIIQPYSLCGTAATKKFGHMIAVYQTWDDRWGSLSNGREEGISGTSLRDIVQRSIARNLPKQTGETEAYAVPLMDLPLFFFTKTYQFDLRYWQLDEEKYKLY